MKNINPKLKKVLIVAKNKYFIATAVFVLVLFVSQYNIPSYLKLRKQKNDLKAKKEYLEQEIKKDSLNTLKLQNNIKEIERYGREKYMMKKDNEDIYIIRSSKDTINHKHKKK